MFNRRFRTYLPVLGSSNCLFRLILANLLLAGAAFAQTTTATGSIQGTVLGSDGTKIAGARVYAAIPSTTARQKAPPMQMYRTAGQVTTAADGNFTISGLAAGTYVLCASTASGGWLDPCHWSATVPSIALTNGQKLTSQVVTMAKGAVLNVQITDPTGATPWAAGKGVGNVPHDVSVSLLGSNKVSYPLPVASSGPSGRIQSINVPFNLAHTLVVSSKAYGLSNKPSAGAPAPVPSGGSTQTVQIPSGTASSQVSFTVTGKGTGK